MRVSGDSDRRLPTLGIRQIEEVLVQQPTVGGNPEEGNHVLAAISHRLSHRSGTGADHPPVGGVVVGWSAGRVRPVPLPRPFAASAARLPVSMPC